MQVEAKEMIAIWERLLANDDADTAWNMQEEFGRVWNAQKPNSPEREAMAAVWKKAMIKWH